MPEYKCQRCGISLGEYLAPWDNHDYCLNCQEKVARIEAEREYIKQMRLNKQGNNCDDNG